LYGLIHSQNLYIKEDNLVFTKYNKHKKICHLSDIHLGGTYRKWFVEKLVNKVISINPDIVVITGDLFDGSDKVKLDWLLPFNQLTIPILYVTGNHENLYGVDKALSLVNKTNIKHIGEKSVNIDGCVFHGFDFKKNRKLLPILQGYKNNDNEINIVLNHIPEISIQDFCQTNYDIMLCGHTHGGQIFPIHILSYIFNACFMGLYSMNNKHIYVSTGTSTATIPMRILSDSMIEVININ
jgi:predicted MPP superfamily phosphohydrolase